MLAVPNGEVGRSFKPPPRRLTGLSHPAKRQAQTGAPGRI